MKVTKCVKQSFSIIGKEGSTNDGNDFIKNLWKEANSHFNEVAELSKKDDSGNLVGIWGAMSDFSRSFNPWENEFSEGLYLAGVEVTDKAQPPIGWSKWTIPSYEYIYVQCDGSDIFPKMIEYLHNNDIQLAGAVHDYTCPQDGKEYMFFPIRRL